MTPSRSTPTLRLALLAAIVCAVAGCGSCSRNQSPADVKPALSFERAKTVKPALVTTDQLVQLITSDTLHHKVIYIFDCCCKPCLENLRTDLRAMYLGHDTAQWRFYLVAGFNWIHRLVPDAEGNLVEDTLGNVSHFAARYRQLASQLGYSPDDLYLHYNPNWEHASEGVFTPLARRLFTLPDSAAARLPFRCRHEGMPQLWVCDRKGRLLTEVFIPQGQDDSDLAPSVGPAMVNSLPSLPGR